MYKTGIFLLHPNLPTMANSLQQVLFCLHQCMRWLLWRDLIVSNIHIDTVFLHIWKDFINHSLKKKNQFFKCNTYYRRWNCMGANQNLRRTGWMVDSCDDFKPLVFNILSVSSLVQMTCSKYLTLVPVRNSVKRVLRWHLLELLLGWLLKLSEMSPALRRLMYGKISDCFSSTCNRVLIPNQFPFNADSTIWPLFLL